MALRALPLLVLAACTGAIGDVESDPWEPPTPGEGGPTLPIDVPDTCDPETEDLALGALRRVSKHEYLGTVEALFGTELSGELDVWLDAIPEDTTRHSAAEFDPGATGEHVDAYFEAAFRIGETVARDEALLTGYAPCMSEPDAACVERFAAALGRRALKREPSADELTLYRETWESDEGVAEDADRVATMIATILSAPEVTHHVTDAEDQRIAGESLAARLAFTLTGAPPDEALLEDADSLDDAAVREDHARRLLETPEGRRHARQLFTRWLGLHGRFSPENAAALADVEVDGLYDEMREEALDFVEHVVFEEGGTFRDLMTSKLVFPRTERLAALLGTEQSDRAVETDGDRAGLLTRPAVLISNNPRTSPILRGVFVWERLLCEEFSLPPSNADEVATRNLETIDPDRSTSRTRTETMTGSSECAHCHRIINAPGFALSRFGPLGEEWDEEHVYAAPGELLTTLPLEDDTTATLPLDEEEQVLDGAAQLGAAIAESDRGRSCATRQLFRATHLREPVATDTCHVLNLRTAFEEELPLFEILVRNAVDAPLVLAPEGDDL